MHLSQALLLACSTLAVATPARHWRRDTGESHRSYKTRCPSASTRVPVLSSNSSSAALPSTVEPTARLRATSAGGVPTESSSPSESISTPSSSSVAAPPTEPSPSDAQPPTGSSTVAAPAQSSTAAAAPGGGSGATYTASFTQYGAGDTFGSGNCNTATAACGWYSNPGYNAAASQNLFGVGPGAGAGPGCGLCFRVTAKTDPYANNAPLTGTQSIVIKVNNLCPADGNPLCSQSSLTDTNSLGGNVNFDLCKDDGAGAALFGSSGVGAALGTAEQVSCSEWSGSGNLTS